MTDGARDAGDLEPTRQPASGRRRWVRRPQRQTHHRVNGDAPRGDVYAALDLGTNNCRLLVAEPAGGAFRVLDSFSRIIRLGEGVIHSGRISDAAIERALSALAVCRDKMRNRHVTRVRLIATEACRGADNGVAFLERVSDSVGIDLEIVDRGTEARLAATGCTPLLDPHADGAILFDIGGGSSEIVKLGANGKAFSGPPPPTIECWASLPMGVVSLAERYGGKHVTPQTYEAMIAEVGVHVDRFAADNGLSNNGNIHLLGTSGTVTTIAGVHLNLPRYDRRQVDGCWMNEADVSAIVARLLAMTHEQRVANPCIGAERADLVLAGCAILDGIRRTFPCPRLRVADRGLREGMLVEMMRNDGVWDQVQGVAQGQGA
jgi:exopolyphosphatase/guanosine-5'-triphosphate,3'-diphosphate pyrophosphatase